MTVKMENSCEAKQKPKTFKELIRSWYLWKQVLTFVAGSILGFFYYHFVGCASGTCPITSSAYASTIMGGVMGLFLLNSPCASGKC
jgi:hypothetical protein